jgi:hypothetical protein
VGKEVKIVKICKENHGDFYQKDICTYGDSIADTDITPECEVYLEQDEYGHCIKDRCSNWDIVLGECTEQQCQLEITD